MHAVVEKPRLTDYPDCPYRCSMKAPAYANWGKPMTHETQHLKSYLDDKVFDHILVQSSMKVRMCLTLFLLIKVVEGVKIFTGFVDELLAINAVGFLFASIISYFAVKELKPHRKQIIGKAGGCYFHVFLGLPVIICKVIAISML